MLRGWYGFFVDRWEALRESYWFVPAQLTFLAAIAAMGLAELDRRRPDLHLAVVPWIGDVTAASARSVLSTIAGSMMTITGVVFSITIVALTLASSQFGPRLLRTFLRDRGSQLALGTFLATFLFNLLVLRAVEQTERVPLLATAAAVVLATGALFVLIYFIHHAASSIQASSIVAAVANEIDALVPRLFPDPRDRGDDALASLSDPDRARLERCDAEGETLSCLADGYLRIIDYESLVQLARDEGFLLRILVQPGDFLARGRAIARVLPAGSLDDDARQAIVGAFVLGEIRTPAQDVLFSIGQLVQMAVRALSPSTNDPGTAIACIHRLGALLSRLSERAMPSGLWFDEEGSLLLRTSPVGYAELVGSCLDSIRRYGIHDPDVAVAMLEAIEGGVRHGSTPERRRVLLDHVEAVERGSSEAHASSERDRILVAEAIARTRAALEAP